MENKDSLFFVRNRVNGFTVNASAAYGGEEDYGFPRTPIPSTAISRPIAALQT